MSFDVSYERMLAHEGGYRLVHIAGDKGGMTYAGISRRAWPKWEGWAYIDQGREVPQSWVQSFYQTQFWNPLQADALPPDIADALFNFAVNAGLQTAIKLAQLVAAVRADGVIGPKTLSALQKIDEQQFIALYTLARIKRYAEICNKDRTQQKFLLGWMNRTLTVL